MCASEDHGKKYCGKLPGVAAHANGVENEVLDEGCHADGRAEAQSSGPHYEEVEGLKKLVLGIEGGRLDSDRRRRLAMDGVPYSMGWFRPSDIWAYNTWL